MKARMIFYIVAMYVAGTILWMLTLLVSGMLNILELAQGFSSPLVWIILAVMLGGAIGYINNVLSLIRNGHARKAVRRFFYVEVLIALIYAIVEPVAVLAFHDWSSVALTITGICIGLAAVFAYAYPFFLQALQTLESACAGKAYAESSEPGIPLDMKMGLVLALMLISSVGIVGATGVMLPELGVRHVLPRIAGVMAITVLFSGITIYFIMRSLKNTLRPLAAELEQADGSYADLSVRLPVITTDETGKVSYLFNRLLQNLSEVFVRVKEDTENVANTSRQLYEGAKQVSEASAGAAASVTEIAATMEQVATSSQQMAVAAQESNSLAVAGKEQMDRMGAQVEAMADTSLQVKQAIEELNGIAVEITGIVDVITQIADQTNLLALNAAIEAARAGEHGQGFAVVAEEVRRLAEQSGGSAREINNMVGRTQEKAKAAVEAITIGGERMQEGLDVVRQVKSSFGEILQKVESVGEGIQQVTAAIQEVSAGVQDLADISEKQNTSMSEISAAGENLSGLAAGLRREVEKFKIHDDLAKNN